MRAIPAKRAFIAAVLAKGSMGQHGALRDGASWADGTEDAGPLVSLPRLACAG